MESGQSQADYPQPVPDPALKIKSESFESNIPPPTHGYVPLSQTLHSYVARTHTHRYISGTKFVLASLVGLATDAVSQKVQEIHAEAV